MQWANRLLNMAAQRQDVVFIAFILVIVAMMVIPMPPVLIDVMLSLNMTVTILLLITAIYLKNPLDFSTLPALILVTTIFRLSLSISSTRAILLHGEAGEIIRAFGQFVISGSVVVGVIIFLIITIVQFLVITKGSERVAEVAARFTLDALPGKQMSIDSDVRSGDIDKVEAKKRRSVLEKESQFYGSMDGAMKFVKGDSIASLIIVAVNMIGGISIGVVGKGMDISEAGTHYSIMTIGDGLIGQIPALLLSISAGAIVTRVTTDESRDLGADITSQLVSNPLAIRIAAVVLTGLCLVPGFPWPIFAFLALIFGSVAVTDILKGRKYKKEQDTKIEEEAAANAPGGEKSVQANVEDAKPKPGDIFLAQLGPDLFDTLDLARYAMHSELLRSDIQAQLGVPFPRVGVLRNATLDPRAFRIDVEGVPVFEGEIPEDRLLIRDGLSVAQGMGVPFEQHSPLLAPNVPSVWVGSELAEQVAAAGIAALTPAEALAQAAIATEQRYASHILGLQETQNLLNQMEETYKDLVKEARRLLNPQKASDVFKRLLDEGVSLGNVRTLMEAIIEWTPREEDPAMLTEYIRSALKRQISHQYADRQKKVYTYLVEGDAEEAVRRSVRRTSVGSYLALEDDASKILLANIQSALLNKPPEGTRAVILTALDVRRFVRSFVANNNINIPVLSYQELAPEFTVQPVGAINMRPPEASAA
jgi:type III secretion protein V